MAAPVLLRRAKAPFGFCRSILGISMLSLLANCSHTTNPEVREAKREEKPLASVTGEVTEKTVAAPPVAARAEAAAEAEDRRAAPSAPPVGRSPRRPTPTSGKYKEAKEYASDQPKAASAQLAAQRAGASSASPPKAKLAARNGFVGVLPAALPAPEPGMNTEAYAPVKENSFLAVHDHPLSTFSIDVDTASYSNSRRFLRDGTLPPKDAIRIEEWVNYFAYQYEAPPGNEPFAVNTEVSACPWNSEHRLVRIGIKGKQIQAASIPPRNLVFLIDVSGSMLSPDKLPLVKKGLALLADSLRPEDNIAISVYAGNSGLVLPATSGRERGKILAALDALEAGGSTNGGEGIQLAYAVAQSQFKTGGINRVILATDGDFNVGTTSEGELTRLIEEKRKSGVFLTVLGFGRGNIKDSTMEMLADKGNGNYAYLDTLEEAKKVLVREAGSTLVTIAKDVKLQVEFNPRKVQSYKLVGYENRLLAKEDFNDDRKDAGEIGAGHTVTAFYEVVPRGATAPQSSSVDPLKYQSPGTVSVAAQSDELLTVNVRYKPPQGDVSRKFGVVVKDRTQPIAQTSEDYRFGAAVANVALLLRGSPDVKRSSLSSARALAAGALGQDSHGDRREFLAIIDAAQRLSPKAQ